MLTEEKVTVLEIMEKTDEVVRLKTNGGSGRAILYKRLQQNVNCGDEIIINTTATELELGTGGWDIVRAVVKGENDIVRIGEGSGHIMKARYLSDQHSVLTVESPESDSHPLFKKRMSLRGKKVLICELHSMLPILWFLIKLKKGRYPLSVIFSDEASLPLVMSHHLAYLKTQADFFSITAGQSFGGQQEAVNIATALQYIMEKQVEGVTVITLGPGVVGTNSHYGFSSLAQAEWANLVGALGGTPVWIPRLSEADPRERHQGISHHTITPLTELTLTNSVLPLPSGEYADRWLQKHQNQLKPFEHVKIVKVNEDFLFPYLEEVQQLAPFPLTSMGRTIDKDPLFFLGIASALHWYLEALHQASSV